MSTNRLFSLLGFAALLAVIAVVVSGTFARASDASPKSQQSGVERAERQRYGAIPQNSPQYNAAQALRERNQIESHGEALQQAPRESSLGEWYGAIPQSSSQFNAARAAQQREIVVNHGEALLGVVQSIYGEWYGAIPQTSAGFNATAALQLREQIEQHSEALAK